MGRSPEQLARQLERERRARLEAERLLEVKSEELYDTLMQVKSSEVLLRSALKSMQGGMLMLDQSNRVVLLNEQMKALYPDFAPSFVHNADLSESFPDLVQHHKYQSVKHNGAERASFEIGTSQDRTILIDVRRTQEGYLASTHLDISQRLVDEEERRQLMLNLVRAQRMETIGRMSGMIAHDFNNLIAVIKGYAGFLADDLASQAGQLRSVKSIQAATDRAEQIIRQIIEFTNEQRSPNHDVSHVPVIEDCLDLMQPTLPDNIKVTMEAPEQPVWVQGNETKLSQVWTNLLTNACHAMKGSGGVLAILVEVLDHYSPEPDDEARAGQSAAVSQGSLNFSRPCVRTELRDSGHGMTSDVLQKAFDMHFTTRDKGGGLGLPSVAEIVVEYGGGIRITSEPGEGTTIEVLFPVVSQQTLAGPEQAPLESADFREADVLLIDDDQDVGEMLRLLLERAGISVEFCEDAASAQKALLEDSSRWKVVVSDQIMPRLKGSEILIGIRENGVRTPFLLCSAYGGNDDAAVRALLGDDFIPKPIDEARLLDRVRHYL